MTGPTPKAPKSRRPTLTQLVARRNRVAQKRVDQHRHDAAIRARHGLPEYPQMRVDRTFPIGKPHHRIGATIDGIMDLDGETPELLEARRAWWRKTHTVVCDALWAAEAAAGIVEDEKRDNRWHGQLWRLDEIILETPARTPAELLAKAYVTAHLIVGNACPLGFTVSKLLALSDTKLDETLHEAGARAMVRLYRDMARMLGKLPSPPLNVVADE